MIRSGMKNYPYLDSSQKTEEIRYLCQSLRKLQAEINNELLCIFQNKNLIFLKLNLSFLWLDQNLYLERIFKQALHNFALSRKTSYLQLKSSQKYLKNLFKQRFSLKIWKIKILSGKLFLKDQVDFSSQSCDSFNLRFDLKTLIIYSSKLSVKIKAIFWNFWLFLCNQMNFFPISKRLVFCLILFY